MQLNKIAGKLLSLQFKACTKQYDAKTISIKFAFQNGILQEQDFKNIYGIPN